MKVIFLALNSSYVHTLLAPRYLVANCSYPVEIVETNVNASLEEVADKVSEKHPDVLAISCYIFNIKFVKELLVIIKRNLPDIIIILGGYEVSYNPEEYLDLANYVIQGEGDFEFGKLILAIEKGTERERIIKGNVIETLDSIKSPYSTEYCSQGDKKIIYYESSRGCPFNCSYCMSSNSKVRAFSLDRVYSDLDNIMQYNPKLIKFVDRTFNYNLERAKKIIKYIIEKYSDCNTKFHFEVSPELFDEELLALFSNVRENLMQLEIGIQSFNQVTLAAVNRKASIEKIVKNISFLSKTNVPIHTDLIAGLPHEGYKSFVDGFNKLYLLGPGVLQLGFLKILKGAPIEKNIDNYRISAYPPYEILSTPWLSENELADLKIAEDMLDLYHNSNRFKNSLSFIIPLLYSSSPFFFFYELGKYYISMGLKRKGSAAPMQSQAIYDFVKQKYIEFNLPPAKLNDVLYQLAKHLNADYKRSGNNRKWKRNIK